MAKNLSANAGDTGSISGWGRSLGVGNGLSGKFRGQGSLLGYSPGDHKESDTTEHVHTF